MVIELFLAWLGTTMDVRILDDLMPGEFLEEITKQLRTIKGEEQPDLTKGTLMRERKMEGQLYALQWDRSLYENGILNGDRLVILTL